MALTVAYLTGGQIRLKAGENAPRTLESPYAKSVHDKALRRRQRHAWKGGDDGPLSGPVLWGKAALGVGPQPVLATSMSRGSAPGQLVYSLASGTLYFIRRPHAEHTRIRPLRVLKDTVLLPFRLLYAVFQFFNVFSVLITGRKLNTPPGTPKRDMSLQQMIIWGNAIQAQQGNADNDAPNLVPSSWELIRQRPDAAEEVLARNVLAYDLAPDGTIAYSNGSAISLRHRDRRVQRLVTERLIEQVVIL